MPGKKRRSDAAGQGDSAPTPAKRGSWTSVTMGMELMKEFEDAGGLFVEEIDDGAVGVTYGDADGSEELAAELGQAADCQSRKKRSKQPRKKKVSQDHGDGGERRVDGGESVSSGGAGQKGLGAEHSGLPQEEQERSSSKPEGNTKERPAPPLPAWVPFDLHPLLMDGIRRLDFHTPTDVQAQCLAPAIRQRKDIVAAAETGSGKTLAFGLPILHHTLCAIEAAGVEPVAAGQASVSAASHELRALVVLPTRELAVQVQGHINAVARGTTLHAECLVGGIFLKKQQRLLKRHPQVVVGTPGRMFALLGLGKDAEEERCDWLRESLRGVRHLVLDEADRLVESGHFKELDRILALLYESLARPQQLQTFVFSATLTLDPRTPQHRMREGTGDGGKVGNLMRRLHFREARAVHLVDLTDPGRRAQHESADAGGSQRRALTGAPDAPSSGVMRSTGVRLPEQLLFCEARCANDGDREAALASWLLRRYRWGPVAGDAGTAFGGLGCQGSAASLAPGGRVVLFVNAISAVMRLTSVLSLLLEAPSAGKLLTRVRMTQSKEAKPGLPVEVLELHSKMRQKDRLRQMERFRKLANAVLVCTDIAARGLDVPEIAAVVHVHAPRVAEVFVHRSGRTARAGRCGESISLVVPEDAAQWVRVYHAVGIAKARIEDISPSAYELSAGREAARLAVDLEKKLHRTAKQQTDASWLRRTAEEAELALSEDEEEPDAGRAAAPRRALWGLYQQLLARVRRLPRRAGGGPLPRGARR